MMGNGKSLLENITEYGVFQGGAHNAMPCAETDRSDDLLIIQNGTFRIGNNASSHSWDNDTATPGDDPNVFAVKGIDLSLTSGKILAIVSLVGSRKTTIINTIFGEVAVLPETTLQTCGKVAYASQSTICLGPSHST